MCCFISVIKIQTIFEYSRDDSKSVEKLKNITIFANMRVMSNPPMNPK